MHVLTRSSPLPPPFPASRTGRQSWLDVLRGIAALVVVFEHSLDALLPEVRNTVSPWFDFGQYGVLVFFLVSGYVIPVSPCRWSGGSPRTPPASLPMRLGWEVLLFAAVIGAAALGHRYVEVAGQRLGRRLARARTPSPGNTSRGIAGETAEPPRKVATFR